tara:strand:- start:9112 stop:9522 length:411 start_codon:yes stop_codon:yes gene_type:complete
MTDITITAANVAAGANAVTTSGKAGATITAGQVVYRDAATGKFKLADSNSATAADKDATGIALNSASDGQPLTVQTAGDITIGATVVAGTAYYASETAGGIQPAADVGTEDVILIGIAKSASVIGLKIFDTGVTVA